MSSSDSSGVKADVSIQRIYKGSITSSSSVEPPMAEWSSLISLPPIDSPKMALYKQGLYDPGSGEICTKYAAMSDSSVLRHVYYAYPGLKDPGIREALLEPEEVKIYPLDGQKLYLDLCKEMNVVPVRSFLRGLLEDVIDLKYYGVNPGSVRAMCVAMSYNRYVKRLDLSSNFLSEDSCYHLGQMLRDNATLQELILAGCRIQAEGARRLFVSLSSRGLSELDLSRNQLDDSGFQHLADQLIKGAVIKRLNLSYNNLGPASASAFAVAIEGNKTITHLDISWNKMATVKETSEFLKMLADSKVLIELNMSWNNLKIGTVLKAILSVPSLRILDLSNNRLTKLAATTIVGNLQKAKNLHTLNLSYNPLTAADAFLILNKLRTKTVKLVNLFMDNIEVEKNFLKEYKEIMALSFRKKIKVTYGEVRHNYELSVPDIRTILMKRIDYLTAYANKKNHLDIAVYFLQKKKTCDNLQPREILRDLKQAGTPVDEDLINGLVEIFPGPKIDKGGTTLDLTGIVEMIKRLWPDKKPPPTPPEPEPVPPPKLDDKKKK